MPLTVTKANTAKPDKKAYKLADEKGLYLLVQPTGGKLWRLDYRFDRKRKTLALGKYPEVSLKDARDRRDEARSQIASGLDPMEVRNSAKQTAKQKQEEQAQAEEQAALLTAGIPLPGSFETVAREWFTKQEKAWVKSHSDKILRRLERDVFPYIGNKPVAEITSPDVLAVVQRIEERGVHETAHRAKQNIGQIMRYAIAIGLATKSQSFLRNGVVIDLVVVLQHFVQVSGRVEPGGLQQVTDAPVETLGHAVGLGFLRRS